MRYIYDIYGSATNTAIVGSKFHEQVATYFNKPELEDQLGIKLSMIAAFVFGFGAMSLLATW
ncbi:hypothetical protein EON65_45030, partial [archaeon]